MSQEDSVIVRNLWRVSAALFVLMLVIVVTARSVSAAEDKMDPRVAASINERLAPLGQVRTGKIEATASASAGKADAKGAFQANCFACHGTGAAGAPKLGDKAAWKARIAQGKPTLYGHAIKGFKGMPPKGGSSLDDDTVKAIVDYMVSQGK